MARHHRLVNDALLNGPKAYSSREGFQALAGVHLYKHVGRAEPAIEAADVENAKDYMQYCGLDTAFLDSYLPPRRKHVPSKVPTTCPNKDLDNDIQPLPPGSASQTIPIDEALYSLTTPNPSTPVLPRLPESDVPQFSLTPVAQRHHTPAALSPVPLRLGTPLEAQASTESPSFHHPAIHQSTGSNMEVTVDATAPVQGQESSLRPAANRDLAHDGNSTSRKSSSSLDIRGSSPCNMRELSAEFEAHPLPAAGAAVQENGNTHERHHPNPSADIIDTPSNKRQKLDRLPETPVSVVSPSGLSTTAYPTANGTHANGLNGTAESHNGTPSTAKRPILMPPVAGMGGPVQQMPSSMTEEREQWVRRHGYTGEGRNGVAVDILNGSARNGHGNGNGNAVAENGNGVLDHGLNGNGKGNANGHATAPIPPPPRKRGGRPKKAKA
ncbi:MAG: hypothetical protein Q9169_008573 [Polycauliona sp. 2 TL-2023]